MKPNVWWGVFPSWEPRDSVIPGGIYRVFGCGVCLVGLMAGGVRGPEHGRAVGRVRGLEPQLPPLLLGPRALLGGPLGDLAEPGEGAGGVEGEGGRGRGAHRHWRPERARNKWRLFTGASNARRGARSPARRGGTRSCSARPRPLSPSRTPRSSPPSPSPPP